MHLLYKASVRPLDSYCSHTVKPLVHRNRKAWWRPVQLSVGSSCNILGHIQDTPGVYQMFMSDESCLGDQLEEMKVSREKERPVSKGSEFYPSHGKDRTLPTSVPSYKVTGNRSFSISMALTCNPRVMWL